MGDISYKPLIDSMTWSYSRVKSFSDCPYKWFLSYIDGGKESPMFYASYGSFIHKLIDKYYSGDLQKSDLQSAFLLGFSENVHGERPKPSTVEKYIMAGSDYFKYFEPFPFEKMATEEEIKFDIDGIPFVAIPDYIGTRDGKIAIVDNKSRELSPRSTRSGKETAKDRELDDILVQLYIYAHAVYKKYGVLPDYLCFNCFRNRKFIEERFNQQAYERSLSWAKKEIDAISKEDDFYPQVDYFRCKYLCGFHNECCYYLGG